MRFVKLTLVSLLAAVFCSSCAPHMNVQQSIKPYEKRMPEMPSGSVPAGGRLDTYTLAQSKLTKNPTPDTATNRDNGRIFYAYYCRHCHGDDGHGDGPVGQSYVPKPIDLTSPRVAALTDGQLYWKMLNGGGHSPIMVQTVVPEHRWPLVRYVRTEFAKRRDKGLVH